jgi:hypothetical protein
MRADDDRQQTRAQPSEELPREEEKQEEPRRAFLMKGRSKRKITCVVCKKERPAGSVIHVINDAFYCASCGKKTRDEL